MSHLKKVIRDEGENQRQSLKNKLKSSNKARRGKWWIIKGNQQEVEKVIVKDKNLFLVVA